jgi:hypothetical protein
MNLLAERVGDNWLAISFLSATMTLSACTVGAGLIVVALDFVGARFAKQRRAARRAEGALAV